MAGHNVTMPDAEMDLCIQRVAQGDAASFKALYDAFYRPIYLFALALVKDHQLAEDVLQESFLSVLASAKTYRPGTKPRAWIYAIARNAGLAALKKSPERAFLRLDEAEQAQAVQAPELPEGDPMDGIEALAILSAQERQIIFLYVYAGFRQTEIARILQMPYNAVRSQYDYAIKKLKRFYTQQGGGVS